MKQITIVDGNRIERTLTAEEERLFNETALKGFIRHKIQQLKEKRDTIIFSPFNGVQVDTSRSREDVQGAVAMWTVLGDPPHITWTMADNSEKDLTKAELEAIINGFALRKMATFDYYQQLKSQVQAATTVSEVEAIQW